MHFVYASPLFDSKFEINKLYEAFPFAHRSYFIYLYGSVSIHFPGKIISWLIWFRSNGSVYDTKYYQHHTFHFIHVCVSMYAVRNKTKQNKKSHKMLFDLGKTFNWKLNFTALMKKFQICGFYLPVIVHNSRRHSSRLLMTAKVLCSSSGASKNGNMAAPISEYRTTNTHNPGVENKIRNVKCIHRFVWITFTVSSLSTTISPSLFSNCDIATYRFAILSVSR